MKDKDPLKGNHSVHYILLDHEILKGLKGRQLMTTWLVWCYIIHWQWTSGSCVLPQTKLSKAWKCHNSYIKFAVDYLTKHKMIKCIEKPSYKHGKSGVYKIATACIEIYKNLYRNHGKPVASDAKPVAHSINHNNSNNKKELLIKDSGNDSSFSKESSPESNNETIDPFEWLEARQKARETNGNF